MKAGAALGALLGLMAMAISTGASAQDTPLGTLLPHGAVQAPVRSSDGMAAVGAPIPKGRALMAARDAAACLVQRFPGEVGLFLGAASTASQPLKKWIAQPHLDDCFSLRAGDRDAGAELDVGSIVMPGLLTDAWLRENSWSTPAAEPKVRQSYEAGWMVQDGQRRIVEEMGACMAATQPEVARQLILAAPDSKAEKDAFKGVIAVLPSCFAKGASLQIDKTGLRLALALGLYHRVVDPASPAAAINEKK